MRIDRRTANSYLSRGRPIPTFARTNYVKGVHAHLMGRYRPSPYDGKITIIRGKESREENAGQRDLGWSRYASKGVDVFDIDALHDDMVLGIGEAPRLLGEVIEKCLAKFESAKLAPSASRPRSG